jgi:hypothetical protein
VLTADDLRERLTYDLSTGWFFRRKSFHRWIAGERAGCLNTTTGRWVIRVENKLYQAHRLAWLYVTGKWPAQEVDHINGDPTDNRWANLREATRSENMANRSGNKELSKSSRFKGVTLLIRRGSWKGQIKKEGKNYQKEFADEVSAAKWYDLMAKKMHGSFARLNFPDIEVMNDAESAE